MTNFEKHKERLTRIGTTSFGVDPVTEQPEPCWNFHCEICKFKKYGDCGDSRMEWLLKNISEEEVENG